MWMKWGAKKSRWAQRTHAGRPWQQGFLKTDRPGVSRQHVTHRFWGSKILLPLCRREALSCKKGPSWQGSFFSSYPDVNISPPRFTSGKVAYPAFPLCANAETPSLCCMWPQGSQSATVVLYSVMVSQGKGLLRYALHINITASRLREGRKTVTPVRIMDILIHLHTLSLWMYVMSGLKPAVCIKEWVQEYLSHGWYRLHETL